MKKTKGGKVGSILPRNLFQIWTWGFTEFAYILFRKDNEAEKTGFSNRAIKHIFKVYEMVYHQLFHRIQSNHADYRRKKGLQRPES